MTFFTVPNSPKTTFLLIKVLPQYQPDPHSRKDPGGIALIHFAPDDQFKDSKVQCLVLKDVKFDPSLCQQLQLINTDEFQGINDITDRVEELTAKPDCSLLVR